MFKSQGREGDLEKRGVICGARKPSGLRSGTTKPLLPSY